VGLVEDNRSHVRQRLTLHHAQKAFTGSGNLRRMFRFQCEMRSACMLALCPRFVSCFLHIRRTLGGPQPC
jgi:hypothetical protein